MHHFCHLSVIVLIYHILLPLPRHLFSPDAQSMITVRIEADTAITVALFAPCIPKLQPSVLVVLHGSFSSCEVDNHENYHDDCCAIESDTCDITQRNVEEPPS